MKNTPLDLVLPQFQPIAASDAGLQTITASWPCRWDYWTFDLLFANWGALTSAQVLTAVTEIRTKCNDVVVQRIDATILDKINQYYKAPAFNISTNPWLSIFHRKLGVRGGVQGLSNPAGGTGGQILYSGSAPDVALETCLNTGSANKAGQAISSLVVEIDIVGSPAGPPTITPYAQVTDFFPGGAGLMRFISKTNILTQVTANNLLTKNQGLAFGDIIHAQLDAFFILPPTGVLTGFTFRFNNIPILQRLVSYNFYMQSVDALRNPAAPAGGALVAFEWSPNGYNDEVLATSDPATDLELYFSDTVSESTEVVQIAQGYPFGLPDNMAGTSGAAA
jgi:hypothetical protein